MNKMPTIRVAEMKDLDGIFEIEKKSFIDGIMEERSVFQERLEVFPEGILVAEDIQTGKILGYVCVEFWTNIPDLSAKTFALGHSVRERHDLNGSVMYGSSFGVLPEFRGSKLGLALFTNIHQYILASFPRINKSILIVSSLWTNAQEMYVRGGYERIGLITGFFKGRPDEQGVCQNADGIVMLREFPGR